MGAPAHVQRSSNKPRFRQSCAWEEALLISISRALPPQLCSGHPDPHRLLPSPTLSEDLTACISLWSPLLGLPSIYSTEICYLKSFHSILIQMGSLSLPQGIPTPRLSFLQRRNMMPSRRWFIGVSPHPPLPFHALPQEHLWGGGGGGQAGPDGFQMCFPCWRVTFSTHVTLKNKQTIKRRKRGKKKKRKIFHQSGVCLFLFVMAKKKKKKSTIR